jgi:OOP family OmpA-OmpF porin
MRIARALGISSLVALAITVNPAALAADAGWFAGFNLGHAQAKIDDGRISTGLLGDGLATTSISDGSQHLGFRALGGYDFSRNFAVDADVFDLGRFGFTANSMPAGMLRRDFRRKAVNSDLVDSLQVGESASPSARAGLHIAETRDSFAGAGAVAVINSGANKRAANYKYGVGGRYDVSRAFALRAEAERYRIDDVVGNTDDIDLYSFGLVYRFGGDEPPFVLPPIGSASAMTPTLASTAAPVLAPSPPIAPVRRKVSFAADSLFDFDKVVIRPAGRLALDTFAAELRVTHFESITVVGHTDRIGSHAYNLKLSTRRADAVKDYLVGAAGIHADRVTARGVNGDEPLTKAQDCKGQQRTPQLIACLQPDRRVEVEVAGSRLDIASSRN